MGQRIPAVNGIPQIGFGTYGRLGEDGIAAIVAALDMGYRHLDTAQDYGTEVSVGQAAKLSGVPRPELFVTTKVSRANLHSSRFIPSVRESLDTLQLEQVDLLLIHWPVPEEQVPFESYIEALGEALAAGYTRLVGVSNFNIAMIDRAEAMLGQGTIATNQVEVHPFLQNRTLRAHCAAKSIVTTAYMPLAKGKVSEDPTIKSIAYAHACEPAQVSLAFLIAEGLIVIPASGNAGRMKENLAALELRLTPDEITLIRGCERGGRMIQPKLEWWDV